MTYLSDRPVGGVRVAAPGTTTRIAVSDIESAAVARAVRDLADDLAKVCPGAMVEVVADATGAQLVVGTIGVSPLLDATVAALDIGGLRQPDRSMVWEGFTIQTIGEQVFIAGTDRRGTIYGIYDLCEAMGVSPWWWFGDVPVRPREHVTVGTATCHVDHPAVKYRGIFLNDEEELDNWARAHTADDTIGPEAYARIFELVLRLKGNYVWPAMHVNAFNHDPANGRLADDMGIVVGTSHCDMLLRSNENEFAPWVQELGEPVGYDYSIPGRNQELLRQYWRDSVQQNGGYEVSWTVGMRGIHDTGFVTSAIDADQTLTPEAKKHAKVALLGQVIRDQRELLASELGERGRDCLQLFIPYKEVLPLYDAGLDLPDDITIVWANDNFGYVRRFPSANELGRRGGHGLYYHSSYWSQPPRSYLATSSTPLALMRHELAKAWDNGIRTLWIDNVGGLKPLELEMEYFLRLAWQADRPSTTASVTGFVQEWVDATFSGGHGRLAGRLYARYYQLNNQRKIEHLDTRVFSQTGYGDEAARRVADLRELYDQTNGILAALPDDERDSFFQLFAVKIHLAYLVSAQFTYADRSSLAYRQGRPAAADAYLAISRVFEAHKSAMLHAYNQVMAAGKWNLMLTPEQAPPPAMALHPVATPALRIGEPGIGVTVWGEEQPAAQPRLEFWPTGTQRKWIDVYSTGAPGLPFTVTSDDWIDVSASSGVLTPDQRITVRIPDLPAAAGRSGAVTVRAAGSTIRVQVAVHAAPALTLGFTGSIEADGYLSLDATRPDLNRSTISSAWVTTPWLGRDHGGIVETRGNGDGATLGYRIQLATPGAHLLELHRLPTLDSNGRIRLGVSVDHLPPMTLESPTTDEYRGTWKQAVLDNVERLRLRLPYLNAGEHVLTLHALDRYVALSKLVIYTTAPQRTNLGPRISHHTDRPVADRPDPDPADVDLATLERIAREVYRTDPAAVPPLPAVYTGTDYHEGGRALARPQSALGRPRPWTRPDGTKDILADLGSGTACEVEGRIAIEAEYALAGTADAWTTPSLRGSLAWSHLVADTDGGTGLALWVDAPGVHWTDPRQAPGLHYQIEIETPGRYRVWLLVKYNHKDDDACWIALDGTPLPSENQFTGGQLFGWDAAQRWHWAAIGDVEVTRGRHVLSVLAREAGLRVDRIYLTIGDELPPADAHWEPSPRATCTTDATPAPVGPAAV